MENLIFSVVKKWFTNIKEVNLFIFFLYFYISINAFKTLWLIYMLLYLINFTKNIIKSLTKKELFVKKPIFTRSVTKTLFRLTDALSVQAINQIKKKNIDTFFRFLQFFIFSYIFKNTIFFLDFCVSYSVNLAKNYKWNDEKNMFINLIMFLKVAFNSIYFTLYEKFKFLELI